MAESDGLHVVVGGTGATGRVVVRELAARGKRVRAVNRSGRADVPEGVEVRAANATDPASMREACRDAAVVYHCAMPPFGRWVELFPPMMEAVIEGAASADAKLVFADDTWMYGKPEGAMTEDLPLGRYRARGCCVLGCRRCSCAPTTPAGCARPSAVPESYTGPPWSRCWDATCSGRR